eukprot:CAMPEP_0170615458 /NCGR_PEP_ID=MMETSP0224-20130122/25347_1 /TAXON_ID=285029 /ORGANISM="Togula jolla, Strain CCCM 725" /LENGTH=37 /DNA_ID= /DNA_START= /DNA_END= /DNA_ORIENTATION=
MAAEQTTGHHGSTKEGVAERLSMSVENTVNQRQRFSA